MKFVCIIVITLLSTLFANDYGDTYINSGNVTTTNNYNTKVIRIDTTVMIDTVYQSIYVTDSTHDTLITGNLYIEERQDIPLSHITIWDSRMNVCIQYDNDTIRVTGLTQEVATIYIRGYPSNSIYTNRDCTTELNDDGLYDIIIPANRFQVDRLSNTYHCGNALYREFESILKGNDYIKFSVLYSNQTFSEKFGFNTMGFNRLLNRL